jgi:hypothetical protein
MSGEQEEQLFVSTGEDGVMVGGGVGGGSFTMGIGRVMMRGMDIPEGEVTVTSSLVEAGAVGMEKEDMTMMMTLANLKSSSSLFQIAPSGSGSVIFFLIQVLNHHHRLGIFRPSSSHLHRVSNRCSGNYHDFSFSFLLHVMCAPLFCSFAQCSFSPM